MMSFVCAKFKKKNLSSGRICHIRPKYNVQYLITMLERILLISVVMVLAFGARGHWFESRPDIPYFSAMHLFICFFVTDFVRKMGARPGLAIEPLIPLTSKNGLSA